MHRFPIDNGGRPYFNVNVTLGDNALNDNVVNHYNAFDQLTRSLTRDKKTKYEYDANGLRTKKTVNGEETRYVWDGDQIVLELDKDHNVKKRYVGGARPIYMDGGAGTERSYYVYNSRGDVMQLLDETGRVIKAYEYDAFGNEVEPDRKDENPFRFAGEYYDGETETVYLRARYYAPVQGRFISEDPIMDGTNWYSYCEGDPVNRIDPSGLASVKQSYRKELVAMTNLKKGSKKFREILAKAVINRNGWLGDYNDFASMQRSFGTTRLGASKMLARLIFGEATAIEFEDSNINVNAQEVEAMWKVVKNKAKGTGHKKILKVLTPGTYHGLKGVGRTPAVSMKWCRAVILGTVYNMKKQGKMKTPYALTGEKGKAVVYWRTYKLWTDKARTVRKDGKIYVNFTSKGPFLRVTHWAKYADTVFHSCDEKTHYTF